MKVGEYMEKIRTTIYIDKRLWELFMLEVDPQGASRTIEELLSHYVSTSSTEEINRKLEKIDQERKILEQKKHDMLQQGLSEDRMEGMNCKVLDNIQGIYKKRREQLGNNIGVDESWIMSPKNISKSKILGKEPLVLLHELRDWYKKRD